MNQQDEILDLVDENDQVIGTKSRSQVIADGNFNFRAINAFLQNSKGELWIPKRTLDKRIFPGCWDMSVGGHVESGETYESTLIRETKEELNLSLQPGDYRSLGKLNPYVHGVSAFMEVFCIETDVTPHYNPRDFTEARWIKPVDLLHGALVGKFWLKGDLAQLVRLCFVTKDKVLGFSFSGQR